MEQSIPTSIDFTVILISVSDAIIAFIVSSCIDTLHLKCCLHILYSFSCSRMLLLPAVFSATLFACATVSTEMECLSVPSQAFLNRLSQSVLWTFTKITGSWDNCTYLSWTSGLEPNVFCSHFTDYLSVCLQYKTKCASWSCYVIHGLALAALNKYLVSSILSVRGILFS